MTVEDTAYEAARHGAALFDRCTEGRLRITGPDRVGWLQGLVTNDVATLVPGAGCYAAYLTPQGRMITDLRVLALPDALLVDVPGGSVADVRTRFDNFIIMEDVTVDDVTALLGRVALHGPRAASVLASALVPGASIVPWAPRAEAAPADVAQELAALPEHGVVQVQVAHGGPTGTAGTASGMPWLVAGTRELGVPGFDIYVPAEGLAGLTARLVECGAAAGSAATWEILRVEQGTPAFGIDMDQDTIPLEAGIQDRAISFTKGCYVGQEIIVRVMHRGHGRVARRLVRLSAAAPAPGAGQVRRGDVLRSEDGSREVGRVTSAVVSPRLGRDVALGTVQRDWAVPGTVVLAGESQVRLQVG